MSDTNNSPENEFDELNAQADSGELTQDSLHEKLNSYRQAFEEEFRVKSEIAPENVEEYTRDFFKKNVHMAAAQIAWLAQNSAKDSIRLAACKVIVSEALADARADGDPIKDIINGLKAKKQINETASSN